MKKKPRLGSSKAIGLPEHCARHRCNNEFECLDGFFCQGMKIILPFELKSHDIDPANCSDSWLDSESTNRNVMLNLK